MFKNIALITQVGLSMITPILLGVYIGGIIDEKVGTNMVFRIIFILLGVVVAFIELFRMTYRKDRRRK